MTPHEHHHHHLHASTTGPEEGGVLSRLFEVYVPRQECMFNQPDVVWTHVVSDTLIMLAYFSIPFALVYFYKRRTDLAFNWIFILFATFIFACGLTHLFQVIAVWNPLYRLEGWVKVVTAVASVLTATVLWPLIPKALALPSPGMLREEIEQRRRTQEQLRATNETLEERVRERTAELERLSRLKDDFIATLSHEMRTPLNAIMGWASLLCKEAKGRDDEHYVEGITVIERNARIQSRLIEDLLDMQRIIAGKFYLDVRMTDLAEVVTSAMQVVRPTAEAKRIRIETKFEPGLRPVLGDPDRLQQLVWNLLSNAIKFTPTGGWVRVELSQVASRMELRVTDNGQGITREALPYIFDKFSQADQSITRQHGGLGLGLAIVRHVAELHGGAIEAQSAGPGEGATFTVTLPIMALQRHAEEEPGQGEEPQTPVPAEDIDLSGMRILVVDDEPDSANMVQQFLGSYGARVSTANSVAAAMDMLDDALPDLVVSDIAMPVEDGFDLIRQLRERSKVPAIALTALARSEDVERTRKAGYQAHLSKPIEPVQLLMTVASFRPAP